MTEPVSAHTRRFARCIWSLDADLAYARHYPAVSWRDSSSRDAERIAEWHVAGQEPLWGAARARALQLLAEADHLESVAQLVGAASLPDGERIVLLTGRLLREAVLQQCSLSPNDASCSPAKQRALLELVLDVHDGCLDLVGRGISATRSSVSTSPPRAGRATRPRRTTRPPSRRSARSCSHCSGGSYEYSAPIEYASAISIERMRWPCCRTPSFGCVLL